MFYIITIYKMHFMLSVILVNNNKTLHHFLKHKHKHPANVAELVIL